VRRLGLVAVLTVAAIVVPAAPASAHTVSGAGATNFKTTLTAVTPPVAGLKVSVVENGSRLELTNASATDVVVLGYEGEPYLRVGPAGVFANLKSPALYLNTTRQGGTPNPDADPTAPAVWKRILGGTTVRWHDHRVHWMGGRPPPEVRRAPGVGHVVYPAWTVELRQGTTPITVTGTLTWVPGPSPWPWVGLAVALALAVIVAALSKRWALSLAAAVVVLVATDVLHAVGIGLAFAGSEAHRLQLILAASYYSLVAWVVGGVAVYLLARRNVDGLFAATFTAVVIGLFGGVADLTVLYRSEVPSAMPTDVARGVVACALGLGAGLTVGAVLAARRNREPVQLAA